MKFLTLQSLKSIGLAAVLLAVCASSFAGRGGSVSGSLSIILPGDDDGVSFASAGESTESLSRTYPDYGDQVLFGVDLSGGKTDGVIKTAVRCDQGDSVVFVDTNKTDHLYLMEDDPRFHYGEWDGGTAQCKAKLIYCPSSGKNRGTCVLLDYMEFEVTGNTVE